MHTIENTITKTNSYQDESARADNGGIRSTITLSVLIALQFVWFFILGGVFYGYIDSVKTLNALKVDLAQTENQLASLAAHIGKVETSISQEITKQKGSANGVAVIPGFSLLKETPQSSILNQESIPQKSASEEPFTRPGAPSLRKMAQHSQQYHEVNRGETLFQISKRYNISVGEIYRLNNLRENQPILPGQKLIVSPRKDAIAAP